MQLDELSGRHQALQRSARLAEERAAEERARHEQTGKRLKVCAPAPPPAARDAFRSGGGRPDPGPGEATGAGKGR